MNKLELLDKSRKTFCIVFIVAGLIGILGPEQLKFPIAVITIAAIIIGAVLNFMYLKQVKKQRKSIGE